jgi:hypothetical protein
MIDGPNTKLSLGSSARLGGVIPTCGQRMTFGLESLT